MATNSHTCGSVAIRAFRDGFGLVQGQGERPFAGLHVYD